jgi:hypothetical protein
MPVRILDVCVRFGTPSSVIGLSRHCFSTSTPALLSLRDPCAPCRQPQHRVGGSPARALLSARQPAGWVGRPHATRVGCRTRCKSLSARHMRRLLLSSRSAFNLTINQLISVEAQVCFRSCDKLKPWSMIARKLPENRRADGLKIKAVSHDEPVRRLDSAPAVSVRVNLQQTNRLRDLETSI